MANDAANDGHVRSQPTRNPDVPNLRWSSMLADADNDGYRGSQQTMHTDVPIQRQSRIADAATANDSYLWNQQNMNPNVPLPMDLPPHLAAQNPLQEEILDFEEACREVDRRYLFYFPGKSPRMDQCTSIQSSIDICYRTLESYEALSRELYRLGFVIHAVQTEIETIISSIFVVKAEVSAFLEKLLSMEDENKILLALLKEFNQRLVEVNEQRYLLDPREKMILIRAESEKAWNSVKLTRHERINSTMEMVNSNSLEEDHARAVVRMQYVMSIYQALATFHSEFSVCLMFCRFQALLKDEMPKRGCFGKLCSCFVSDSQKAYEEKMERSSNIINTDREFNRINTCLKQLGAKLFEEYLHLKTVFEKTRALQEELFNNLKNLKRIMFEVAMSLQTIVRYMNQLDEKNDALLGKLVKTRPVFRKLYEQFSDVLLTSATARAPGGFMETTSVTLNRPTRSGKSRRLDSETLPPSNVLRSGAREFYLSDYMPMTRLDQGRHTSFTRNV